MSTQIKWHCRFLDMAAQVASWSKDPSTKCGAVIVRPDKTIASVGFNGFPKYTPDDPKHYDDREEKYARTIHAEVNAILHSREPLNGYTMYTMQDPHIGYSCDRCTAHVIQAGIRTVVSAPRVMNPRWDESIDRGISMYQDAGVKLLELQPASQYLYAASRV